jgi:hypothetical protein
MPRYIPRSLCPNILRNEPGMFRSRRPVTGSGLVAPHRPFRRSTWNASPTRISPPDPVELIPWRSAIDVSGGRRPSHAKPVMIGQIQSNGPFDIVYKSGLMQPNPRSPYQGQQGVSSAAKKLTSRRCKHAGRPANAYAVRSEAVPSAACAAASRATGTRNGLQDT